jgi:hypothetical protein
MVRQPGIVSAAGAAHNQDVGLIMEYNTSQTPSLLHENLSSLTDVIRKLENSVQRNQLSELPSLSSTITQKPLALSLSMYSMYPAETMHSESLAQLSHTSSMLIVSPPSGNLTDRVGAGNIDTLESTPRATEYMGSLHNSQLDNRAYHPSHDLASTSSSTVSLSHGNPALSNHSSPYSSDSSLLHPAHSTSLTHLSFPSQLEDVPSSGAHQGTLGPACLSTSSMWRCWFHFLYI